jgi:hypothetical protein
LGVNAVRDGVGAAPAPFPARAAALVAAFFTGGAAFFAAGGAFFAGAAFFAGGAAFFAAGVAFFEAGAFFAAGALDFLAVADAFFTGPEAAFLAVDVVFFVAVAAFFTTGAAFFFVGAGRFPALTPTRGAFDLFPAREAEVERDADPRLAGEPLLAGVILPSFGPPVVAAYPCSLALGSG